MLDGPAAAAAARRDRARRRRRPPAEHLPVARVCVDLPPAAPRPRLRVPRARRRWRTRRVPGTRVKVRFGGQDVNGYVLERVEEAEHDGALAPLRKVVSAEPVLTPAGRAARPCRRRPVGGHARRRAAARGPARGTPGSRPRCPSTPTDAPAPPTPSATAWAPYRGGAGVPAAPHGRRRAPGRLVGAARARRATGGRTPSRRPSRRACWAGAGRSSWCPDARDIDRVLAALVEVGVPRWTPGTRGGAVRLAADDGPAVRYRSFLAALRGQRRRGRRHPRVGVRPGARPGLAVVWDDGDPLHAEPRAPYPHVREVLALRSELEWCALLVAAHGRSVEAQALVESGWAREVAADRATTRAAGAAGAGADVASSWRARARRRPRGCPAPAWRTVRDRLADGPVLVQVPRAGYLPGGRVRPVPRVGALRRAATVRSG